MDGRKRNSVIRLLISAILWIILLIFPAHAGKYNEAYFTNLIATKHIIGKQEHKLPNRKRVDILSKEYAYEVDWISKAWSEGVGQSLHYAQMTNKKPGVIVLIDKPHKANLKALLDTAKLYNIKVHIFYVDKKKGTIK